MSEVFLLSPPLSFEGNVGDNFRKWKQKYTLYMTATERDKKSKEQQAATLLHLIGDAGLEVFKAFHLVNHDIILQIKINAGREEV